MSASQKPAIYYVVFFDIGYQSLSEVMADAPDAIAAHLKRSREWHADGRLLMAGAFRDQPDGYLQTMGVLTSREDAEAFANGDPFVVNGKVIRWSIREWNNMLL